MVEERAHSDHDMLFLPSENHIYFQYHISEVQGSIMVKESKGGGRSLGQLRVESINGIDARQSPFLEALDARFRLHCDHKQLVIEEPR